MRKTWFKATTICMAVLITSGCGATGDTIGGETQSMLGTEMVFSEDTQANDDIPMESEISEEETEQSHNRMVMVNDKLYVETGETSNSMLRCGIMDGQITSSVELGIPAENNQSNFGSGYGYQYGRRENQIEINIEDEWLIFAYNENNFDGVSMEVIQNTAKSATIQIQNITDLQVQYGDYYDLEVFDEETGEWNIVPYILDNYGFHDIAYTTQKDMPSEWKVDWTVFHGSLDPGKYRIVKDFMDFRGTGDYTKYTLTAEFIV